MTHNEAPAPEFPRPILWPRDLEQRYAISAPTRWRWERRGVLPPRDVHLGTRSGWRLETIERLESEVTDACKARN